MIAASGGEENSVRPVDVVLLLDCSGTMQTENRFSNMKEQANSFINKLATDNGDSQVAVVAYGQYSYNSGHNDITTLNNGWTTLRTGAGNLTDALNSQGYLTGDNYSYGTDHGGAYVRAQELLDDDAVADDGRTKYIVNISDGVFDYNTYPTLSRITADGITCPA